MGRLSDAFLKGPTGHFFEHDGVTLHYTDEGKGIPVLLVHGFAANGHLNWRFPGVTGILKKHYRVITMDCRGHGRSSKPQHHGAYGMNMVDDMAALLDHLEIRRAHIVGYSMGGFLGLAFAGKYPDRLITLTQGGSGWYPRDKYPALVQTVPAALDAGEGFEPIVRFMEQHNPLLLEQRIRFINRLLCRFNDCAAMARCFDEMQLLEGTEEQLRSSTVPHLTIMGTADPLRDAADYLCSIGKATHTMFWIERADHTTTLAKRAHARTFTQKLIDFINNHTPQSTGTGSATASAR
jgi:pimeloyl-ACP methyl ester carboxylesterase